MLASSDVAADRDTKLSWQSEGDLYQSSATSSETVSPSWRRPESRQVVIFAVVFVFAVFADFAVVIVVVVAAICRALRDLVLFQGCCRKAMKSNG